MLNEIKRDFNRVAAELGDHKKLTWNAICDGYCDAVDNNDKPNQDRYFAAIILRLFPAMYNFHAKSKGLYGIETIYDKAVNAILYACQPKYRAWRPTSAYYKGNNASQCINQSLHHRFMELPYESNLDIHRANFNPVSMDMPIGDDEDGRTFGDLLEAETPATPYISTGAHSLVQEYINHGKPVHAILLDILANNDTFRHKTSTVKTTNSVGEQVKYTQTSSEYWEYKTVQTINEVLHDEVNDYGKTFSQMYQIPEQILSKALEALRAAKNPKIYKQLRNTLADVAAKPEYYDLLRDAI